MEKFQKRPYYGNLKEAGRPKNSWWRSVIKEAGRSWNEIKLLAADRQYEQRTLLFLSSNFHYIIDMQSETYIFIYRHAATSQILNNKLQTDCYNI